MTDEATMLAAYAAHGCNPTARLILADWYEERGDPRGPWLRDPDLGELMGPQAQSPVPTLLGWLSGRSKRTIARATKLLVRAGRAAVPELLLELANWEYPNRDGVRAILAELAVADTELATTISQLKSDDPRDQRAGLTTLGDLGERGMSAVVPILELLKKDERGDIRAMAVSVLAKLGPAADAALLAANTLVEYDDRDLLDMLQDEAVKRGANSPAVRILTRGLHSGNNSTKESASGHLVGLGVSVFGHIIEEALRAPHDERGSFAYTLHCFTDADARLLTVARDATRDESVRAFAVRALVNSFHCDPPDQDREPFIPDLVEFLGDPSSDVAGTALEQLSWFGPRAASAVPALVRLLDRQLERGDPETNANGTIRALEAIGPPAAVAIDRIRPLVNDERYESAAREFLNRVQSADERAAELRAELASRNANARAAALQELVQSKEPPADMLELLERGLADRVAAVRQAAAGVVYRSDWATLPGSLAFVRKHFAHRDPVIRSLIAGGIPHNGGVGTELLPDLLARLKVEPNARVRQKLLEGLQCSYQIGKGHPAFTSDAVRDAVKAALADPKADVRAAAVVVVNANWERPPAELLNGLLRLVREDRKRAGSLALEELRTVETVRPKLVSILRTRLATERGRWRLEEALRVLNQLDYRPTTGERPILLRAIRRHYSNADAAIAMLGRSGQVAVRELVALLAGETPSYLRSDTAKALGSIGPLARAAVPALQAAFDAEDDWTADAAVQAILAILPRAEAVEALRPAFRSRRARIRWAVLRVAKDFGPDARPWLPELLYLARVEAADYDANVPKLLAGFIRETPTVLDEVLPLLDEPSPAVENALRVIALVGPRAAKAEPKLLALKAEWEGPSWWLDQALKAVQGDGPT